MRDTEADIAGALSDEGWLTVLDGPLHGIHRGPRVAVQRRREARQPAGRTLRRLDRGVAVDA